MIFIYKYDAATGEYLRADAATLDPLEAAAGTERPLVPAHATLVPPPDARAGFARIWGDGWMEVDDRRGVRYWTPAAGLATHATLGALPSGAVLVEGDDPTLYFRDGVWTLDPPTDAQRAARIVLPRATFFFAVDAALDLDVATDGYADEYLQAVVEADASAQTPVLTAEQRVLAVTLIRTATHFARADGSKALLEAIGAMVGLSSANLDTLFLEAAGQ